MDYIPVHEGVKGELIIAMMEIPKGAMIIEGEDNEIVATKMKLIKIL